MKKIIISENKTLKLTNVLESQIFLKNMESMQLMENQIKQMQSYITIKGAKQIGPLVQHTYSQMLEDGKTEIGITILLQCNNYIHHVESPYWMESQLHHFCGSR